MSWKDKINGFLDKLAGWLGLTPAPVPIPIPIRKDPRDRRRR